MTHPPRVAENRMTHPYLRAQKLMTHPLSAPAHPPPPPVLFDQFINVKFLKVTFRIWIEAQCFVQYFFCQWHVSVY